MDKCKNFHDLGNKGRKIRQNFWGKNPPQKANLHLPFLTAGAAAAPRARTGGPGGP